MVSAMILLLGSQVQMYAQRKGGPDFKRPGMEMKMDRRPDGPMDKKAICQGDIEKVQRFFRVKYGVKLSKKEAEKILLIEMRDKGSKSYGSRNPHRMPSRRHR